MHPTNHHKTPYPTPVNSYHKRQAIKDNGVVSSNNWTFINNIFKILFSYL
jgi:phage gp16-like protein